MRQGLSHSTVWPRNARVFQILRRDGLSTLVLCTQLMLKEGKYVRSSAVVFQSICHSLSRNTSHASMLYFNLIFKNHIEPSLQLQREQESAASCPENVPLTGGTVQFRAWISWVSAIAKLDASHTQKLIFSSAVISYMFHCPIFLDGFTHWSLTGSLVTDEDTFMGFNDGLSQSGTCTAKVKIREWTAIAGHWLYLFQWIDYKICFKTSHVFPPSFGP